MGRSKNMISGNLGKGMLVFAIPVLLASLVNLMFNSVDIIVVGQFCGSHAVAAVGATSRIVNLVTFMFLGFAGGFGVVLSHALGEGNKEKISRAVHTAIPFAFVLGVILTAAGILLSKPLLDLLNTPEDIKHDANIYLKIYFAGVILRMIQAFVGPIFRAVGDTKIPLIYLGIGGALNVVCNIFFVKVLGMTVDGVAYGTIISEGVSSIIGIIVLMRRKDSIRFELKKMCFDKNVIKKTVQIGVPNGLQTSMFTISTAIISSAINSLGSTVVAANSAALSIDEIFLSSTVNAFNEAVAVYSGQNYGAGNYKRIREVLKKALFMGLSITVVLGVLINVFSKPLVSIYITDSPEAVSLARMKMLISGGLYFLTCYRSIFAGTLRGMGNTKTPTVLSFFATCLFKVVWVYTVFRIPAYHSFVCLAISYPVAWLLEDIPITVLYFDFMKKTERAARKKQEALEHRRLMQKKKYRKKLRSAKR